MAEETKGLPDVEGLKDFINQDKGQKVQGEVPDPNKATGDLAQFKSPEDLLKSYKEIQGYTTKVSQENKDLKTRLDESERMIKDLNERMEIPPPPVMPQAPAKNFQDLYYEDPEKAIEMKVAQTANVMRIAEVLEEEQGKNPEDFQERYAYANYLKTNPQYAHLSTTPQGVRKLFQIADKVRDDSTKKTAYKSLKMLFGDDVDIEKLRPLIKKDVSTENLNQARNLAYMPDTTSGRTGAEDTNKGDFSSQRNEAAQRGDVDAVLQSIFKEALGK